MCLKYVCMAVYMANCVDPDQIQYSLARDLVLHCLQRPVPVLRVIMIIVSLSLF